MEEITKDNNTQGTDFLSLAESYRKNGNSNEAIAVCKKALQIYPDDTNIRIMLLKIYLEKNLMKEAKEELEKIMVIDHLNLPALTMLETIYRYEGNENELKKIQEKLNSLHISKISAKNEIKNGPETVTFAEIYVKQGLLDEAIKIYEKIALSNPLNTDISNRLLDLRKAKEEQYINFLKKKEKIRETVRKLQESIKQIEDHLQDLEKEL